MKNVVFVVGGEPQGPATDYQYVDPNEVPVWRELPRKHVVECTLTEGQEDKLVRALVDKVEADEMVDEHETFTVLLFKSIFQISGKEDKALAERLAVRVDNVLQHRAQQRAAELDAGR